MIVDAETWQQLARRVRSPRKPNSALVAVPWSAQGD